MGTLQKILLLIMSFVALNVYCVYTYIADNPIESSVVEANNEVIQEEPTEEIVVEAIEKPVTKMPEEAPTLVQEEVPVPPKATLLKSTAKIKSVIENEVAKQTEETTLDTNNNEDIQTQINNIVTENRIIFKRLSTDVTSQSLQTIKKIADILIQFPLFHVEIGGHTDAKGDDEVNAYISKHRALSVKKILVELGVEKERLSTVGYGESQPIVENDPQGYSMINRRVEFKIIKE